MAVVGSANADLVVEVPRRPDGGETLLGSDLRLFAGGKGANQAASAARSGAEVQFHACVGADENAAIIRARLLEAGVDISGVTSVERPTGTALILVTPDGENSIVVSPGANHALDIAFAEAAAGDWSQADVLVLNLESPIETVEHVAAAAAERGVRVLLNAAPAQRLTAHTLSVCDPLVVNEHEARILLDDNGGSSFAELAQRLLDAGVVSVIITLGAAGALFGDRSGIETVSSHPVDVVDTTGAGDAFVGATACELAGGRSLRDAVEFATAVAAMSVQVMGAQSSYPDRRDVDAWRETRAT
ncbi:ribokinase [Microbacterium sp. EST19A]|uniref:ribokinase n=1 Tax=Microbacterium sp. EST19A TaxID=2862681 RepID=UPI0027E0C039|nr:ribokinase [Microbacterium sp. EST19A]